MRIIKNTTSTIHILIIFNEFSVTRYSLYVIVTVVAGDWKYYPIGFLNTSRIKPLSDSPTESTACLGWSTCTTTCTTLYWPYKDGTFSQNYLPICLLPAMSRITKRIILSRLEESTEELCIIIRVPARAFGKASSSSNRQNSLL